MKITRPETLQTPTYPNLLRLQPGTDEGTQAWVRLFTVGAPSRAASTRAPGRISSRPALWRLWPTTRTGATGCNPRRRPPTFFITITEERPRYGDVQFMFQILVSGAGIGANSPVRPRIHDLRHFFAVRPLVDWYRNGENVQTRLTWLATYLGHRDPRFRY